MDPELILHAGFVCMEHNARFDFGSYGNGRLAIKVVTAIVGEPLMVLTVNIPEEDLHEGEFFVKTWSENAALIPGIMRTGYFVDTGRRVSINRVIAQVWKFAHERDSQVFWPK